MTKNRSHASRIFSLLLSLAMVMTLLIPSMAWAAEGDKYTISIYPNANTLTPTGDNQDKQELSNRFTAYAIFEGGLNTQTTGGYDPGANQPNDTPTANQLGNVKWGSGVYSEKLPELLAALCNDDTTLRALDVSSFTNLNKKYASDEEGGFRVTADTTLGKLYTRALQMEGYALTYKTDAVTGIPTTEVAKVEAGNSRDDGDATADPAIPALIKSAAVIAGVISKVNEDSGTAASVNNNSKLANAFAKVVAAHENATATAPKKYTYLSTVSYPSVWNADADSTTPNPFWEIKDLSQAGYYLIVDNFNALNPSISSETTELDEISDYMLAVFGSQAIYLKSNAASVDKTVDNTKDANGAESTTDDSKGVSAEIGDTVTFRLTGTLPENYENYSTFTYIFHDTLSKGLTYADNLKVTVEMPKANPSDEYDTIDIPEEVTYSTGVGASAATVTNYTVTETKNTNGTTALTIRFEDLKKLLTEEGSSIALTNKCRICVAYTATVNQDAVVVDPAANGAWDPDIRNKNSVKLEYSNDVNDENSTGTTTEKTVYVYVFGLEINKVDGTKASDADGLEDAEFSLTKQFPVYTITNGNTTAQITEAQLLEILDADSVSDVDWEKLEENKTFVSYNTEYEGAYADYYFADLTDIPTAENVTFYAVFTMTNPTNGNADVYEYTLYKWIDEAGFTALKNTYKANNSKDWTWGTAIVNSGNNTPYAGFEEGTYYLSVRTVEEGKLLKVKGLDEGVYTLTEEKTPVGYDTMESVSFRITPSVTKTTKTDEGGALTMLEITHSLAENAQRTDVVFDVIAGTDQSATGYIRVTLKNMPSGYLPGTGGLGTVLFYAGGGVLLALGGLHILRRRRRSASAA